MSSINRFATPIDDLPAAARTLAESALAAAEGTFAGFRDAQDSHYFCADRRTPEQTWQALTRQVARVTAIAALEAADGGSLSSSDFVAIHRGIFEPVFGDRTLDARRHEQQVTFGIALGKREKPEFRSQHGLSGRSLPKRLADIASALDRAVERRDAAVKARVPRSVIDATRPAADAYGRFLSAHPFFDGNGRTAFPILNFALIRLGLLAVAVPETEEFHWCLGQRMRRNGRASVEPLAKYLRDLIVSSDQMIDG
jgi:fido (protein-threonine AMPylation protein)